jgi:hypothetical protein
MFLHNYDGAIGDIPIGMTLISDGSDKLGFPGKITGTYFYVKWLKDIEIRGTVDSERNFVFYEYDKAGNTTGSFKGRFSKSGGGELIGTWSGPDGTGGKPFNLVLDNVSSGEIGGRYSRAGVEDDAALEKSAQRFRKAVISRDKQIVAGLIDYPISVTIAGKRRKLSSRAAVIANYDQIFSHKFVEAIRESAPHNMFVRYDGVSLGPGLIWFGSDGKVIAVNNY